MPKSLFILFILFFGFAGFSQSLPLSLASQVSVLTCGSGGELYTTFGHTAIRIYDPKRNLDVVYNYGMFSFSEGNFYLKFIKGDLKYFVAVSPFEEFLLEYKYDKREVIEQTLYLTQVQKQTLFDLLNTSLYTEEKYYTYKFIDRNCTTKVLDKINIILGETQIEKIDSKTITYREVLNPYFENHFWYKLGISIVFGTKVDQKATQLFLPIELLNSLNGFQNNGKPLVSKSEILVPVSQPEVRFSFFRSIYLIASILLLLLLFNSKWIFHSYLVLQGFLGICFIFLGFYSDHKELLLNYNALLFNPLYLLIPFAKSNRFFRILSITCGICLLGYLLIVLDKPHLSLVLPFLLTSFYILIWFWKRRKNQLLTSVV